MYRQHNNPDRFLQYFEESVEKYSATGKQLCILGDYNLDLLKIESSKYSQDFLMCLQSCYLIPTIDKPTRERQNSATLIGNIFVNNPEQVFVSGDYIKYKHYRNMLCKLKRLSIRKNIISVIQIFRADDDSDPNNYRPISLLSSFNRIFEKLMYTRMNSFIDEEGILCSSQYGFRLKNSTEHPILDIVNKFSLIWTKVIFTVEFSFISKKRSTQ